MENKETKVNPLNIVKPLNVAKDDFVKDLVELCNNSKIPMCLIEYILKDFLQEIHIANQRQLEVDRLKYSQELKKIKGVE